MPTGCPGYTVVGLPDTAGRESRERVRAAMQSSDVAWPNKRITVNLSPATVRKTGAGLELAIALALMLGEDELPAGCLDGVGVLGELGLDGTVRAVPGTLVLADALARTGVGTVHRPARQPRSRPRSCPACTSAARRTSRLLRACLKGEAPWPDPDPPPRRRARCDRRSRPTLEPVDLAEVRGLATARLALEIAAAGAHHLLLTGPPGCGKTMLARRLPTILPPLDPDEAVEVTRIASVAGGRPPDRLATRRPFRAPHHTATTPALVGGGSGRPRPGEVTLAHRGVLFLDELGEFPPVALDALRQPLEEGVVRIARQGASLVFPARFVLVGCTNPCPCGRVASECRCTDFARLRYARRLSAPLLDRFDLRLRITGPTAHDRGGRVLRSRRRAGRGRGRTPAPPAARDAVAVEPRDPGRVHRPLRAPDRRGRRRLARRGRGRSAHRPGRGAGSGGSPARSRTSPTPNSSTPSTSSSRRRCARTCRERPAIRRRNPRPGPTIEIGRGGARSPSTT